MLYYKINVLAELKNHGYNTSRIREKKLVSEAQLTKIREGTMVSKSVLEKLCDLLDMQPGDIIGYRRESEQ